jgi:hypothetical protein
MAFPIILAHSKLVGAVLSQEVQSMTFTKIMPGVRTTDFLPPNTRIPGSVSVASGNVSNAKMSSFAGGGGADLDSGEGVLPSLWWLGIIILLVVVRLVDEYNNR